MADHAVAFAPGRVNLIGEHTDYNEGLALPFAISEGVTVRAVATGGADVHAIALDLGTRPPEDRFPLASPAPASGWCAFVRGAVGELTRAGCPLAGARLEITGSVPRGSGLSSSAALEVALCLALLGVSRAPVPDRLELARICSRIENHWVGARTGLLDQIASLFGEADRALLIDFRTLAVTPVALELDGCRFVTLDSGQSHANAGRGAASTGAGGDGDGGYNRRRAECARAAELLGVASLRDVTLEQTARLPAPLSARAAHVVAENERVRDTVAALARGDSSRVGELLNASHASLRDLFEVSTPAVEDAVARLRAAGAIGARVIGGGFGGHVLGLLPPDVGTPPESLHVSPGPGATLQCGR